MLCKMDGLTERQLNITQGEADRKLESVQRTSDTKCTQKGQNKKKCSVTRSAIISHQWADRLAGDDVGLNVTSGMTV